MSDHLPDLRVEDEPVKLSRDYPLRSPDPAKVLRLAGWTLAIVGLFAFTFSGLYVWASLTGKSDSFNALPEIFEFIKIGLLPLAVLILTFYFQRSTSQS